ILRAGKTYRPQSDRRRQPRAEEDARIGIARNDPGGVGRRRGAACVGGISGRGSEWNEIEVGLGRIQKELKALKLITESYLEQLNRWPGSGQHIWAQFDDSSVIVYQAYHPSIGLHAAKHQRFCGDFSFTRMSWIKTNFLWMMYRSGWGTKENQEVTLAVRLRRAVFDPLFAGAVWRSPGGAPPTTPAEAASRLVPARRSVPAGARAHTCPGG